MAELRSHDVDRLFLQALMTRRVVSEDLLKQLFIRSKAAVLSKSLSWANAPSNAHSSSVWTCKGVDADVQVMHDNDWLPFLARVKASLDKLDLNIAKTVNEETGQGVYALVSLVHTSGALRSVRYLNDQSSFGRDLMFARLIPLETTSRSSRPSIPQSISYTSGISSVATQDMGCLLTLILK